MRLFDEVKNHEILEVFDGPLSYSEAKAVFERQYLAELLQWAKGNVKLAADRACRDRKGLYVLMSKHGIDPKLYRRSRHG